MASAAIDHMVSITIFLAAILLFTSLFSQTIQTAVVYQQHRAIATKCSDVLDSIMLNSGNPTNWGQTNSTPTSFGLQDPEFTQYQLSPFSLMRLNSSTGSSVYYPQTDLTYCNLTLGFGQSLYVPYSQIINYSLASTLLGLNGTYGFSLTIAPVLTVTINQVQSNPLNLSIAVMGAGFPLAGATVNYCFLSITGRDQGSYPAYTVSNGSRTTNDAGLAYVDFPDFDETTYSYALIAYAHLSGLTGIGYHEGILYSESFVVPFVSNFETGEVILAHSWDVHAGANPAEIAFNATFVLLSDDFTLREMPLDNETGKIVGKLNYGQDPQHAYANLTINTRSSGILIVTYSKSNVENGVVVMPWGISSLAFTVTFGGDPQIQEWVATDMRQVIINRVAYQAKLSLWSMGGRQVIG